MLVSDKGRYIDMFNAISMRKVESIIRARIDTARADFWEKSGGEVQGVSKVHRWVQQLDL